MVKTSFGQFYCDLHVEKENNRENSVWFNKNQPLTDKTLKKHSQK